MRAFNEAPPSFFFDFGGGGAAGFRVTPNLNPEPGVFGVRALLRGLEMMGARGRRI